MRCGIPITMYYSTYNRILFTHPIECIQNMCSKHISFPLCVNMTHMSSPAEYLGWDSCTADHGCYVTRATAEGCVQDGVRTTTATAVVTRTQLKGATDGLIKINGL